MTTISVRLSEKEKAALKRYGKISHVVKEAITLYSNSKRAQEALKRLRELQRSQKVQSTVLEDLRMIREDRRR